jgi:hypothetical protein
MIAFHAEQVAVTRESGGYVVAWAVADPDAETYLMVQVPGSHDEQDVELGMDDVYIETCGQAWSWYGNIESFELARDRVRVQLSAAAAAQMGDDGRIEATFSVPEETYAELRAALNDVFRGRGYYREVVAS